MDRELRSWRVPLQSCRLGLISLKDVTAYVEQAFEVGFSHIDTAECMFSHKCVELGSLQSFLVYETEQYVGKAIRESGLPREDMYITTKFAMGDNIRAHLEISLAKVSASVSCLVED